jgi:aerobic-type carbon monoxide dehydrogenase small subunit (CoxS/CutS family)
VRALVLSVNGRSVQEHVDDRLLLSDFLRHSLGLRGTHVGCEHGVCGACTVQVDGRAVRSCLMLAAQAEGCHVETVEALAQPEGPLSALQDAFRRHHALQCGFCTSGFLMSAEALLRERPDASERDIREALAGNLCRCTGYEGIVEAVLDVARER